MAKNGSTRLIISIIGIALALGGILWAMAIQSGQLDGAIEDIVEQESNHEKVIVRIDTVEKAIIKIETKMDYIQKGQDDLMEMQRQVLDELRK